MYKIIENTNEQVILEVPELSPLDVAKHPYLSADWSYITVAKGKKYTLTVVKKDGSTLSFSWSANRQTFLPDNAERLRESVMNFLKEKSICLSVTTDEEPDTCDNTL